MMRLFMLLFCGLFFSGFVPDQPLADPQKEASAQNIISELRCFVCQGQPLAQSDAPLARSLRLLVRQQIAEGKSEKQIFAFIAERYGDQVLMNPPLNRQTFILWLLPFFALAFGAALLWRASRGAKQ